MNRTVKVITFCDMAQITNENKVNILGIFDEVKMADFPGMLSRGCFVAVISPQKGKTSQFSITCSLDGDIIFPPIAIEVETGKHNVLIDFTGAIFPEPGDYVFELLSRDEVIGSTTLQIREVRQTTPPVSRTVN